MSAPAVAEAADAMAVERPGTGEEMDAFCELARLSGVDPNAFTITLARACIAAGIRQGLAQAHRERMADMLDNARHDR